MAVPSANRLRQELAERNRNYARRLQLPHVAGMREDGAIVYSQTEDGRSHGNFLMDSYAAILDDELWRKRLGKAHTSKKKLPQLERETARPWCELDSCNSSDALLMNIFCFPRVLERREVISLLGLSLHPNASDARPIFGFKARVPRLNGSGDATEIDMRLGDLLAEAKLTETNFQQRAVTAVECYRDFDAVFDRDSLPRSRPKLRLVHDHDYGEVLVPLPGDRYECYQMIRNILAAYAPSHGDSLAVATLRRIPCTYRGLFRSFLCHGLLPGFCESCLFACLFRCGFFRCPLDRLFLQNLCHCGESRTDCRFDGTCYV